MSVIVERAGGERADLRRLGTLALRAGSLLAFVAVLVFFSATAPFFLSFFNFTNVIAARLAGQPLAEAHPH